MKCVTLEVKNPIGIKKSIEWCLPTSFAHKLTNTHNLQKDFKNTNHSKFLKKKCLSFYSILKKKF